MIKIKLLSQEFIKRVQRLPHLRPWLAVFIAFGFGAIGTYLLFNASAATLTVITEAESLALPANTFITEDSTARGGKSIHMLSAGSATGTVSFTEPVTELVVRAKGENCKGSPQFTFEVDGKPLLTSNVSSTSWTPYTAAVNLPAGSHTIKLSYTNDYYYKHKNIRQSCDRNLNIDYIGFAEQNPVALVPVVSITAPANGSTVNGTLQVSANASDSNGILGVQFKVDGVAIGSEDTTSPYSVSWDSTKVANGSRTLTASARNNSGATSTTTINVNVQNSIAQQPGSGVVSSIGSLRINPNDSIPSDLSRYKVLLLDSARWQQVAGLKSKYPNLKILGYKNLTFVCNYSVDAMSGNSGVTWQQAEANPGWFLRDSSGNIVYSVRFPKCAFMDPMSSSYQRTWSENVLTYMKTAGYDGVFMDDANADVGWHLRNEYGTLAKYPSRDSYKNATRSLLAYTAGQAKTGGYLAIPNIGASWNQPEVWADWASLASGAMRENYLRWDGQPNPFVGADWKIHTDAHRAVEGVGKIFVGLTYGQVDEPAAQRYIRASFLLFWQPANGSVSMWHLNEGTEYAKDLGSPKAAAVQNGSVWTRQFEKGSVTVDTSAGTSTITIF